jgi:hypothetical protein
LTIDSNASGTKVTAIFPVSFPAVKEQQKNARHAAT